MALAQDSKDDHCQQNGQNRSPMNGEFVGRWNAVRVHIDYQLGLNVGVTGKHPILGSQDLNLLTSGDKKMSLKGLKRVILFAQYSWNLGNWSISPTDCWFRLTI